VKLGFAALLRLPLPPLGLGPLGEQGARRLPGHAAPTDFV
jgi:hypothetical protein